MALIVSDSKTNFANF